MSRRYDVDHLGRGGFIRFFLMFIGTELPVDDLLTSNRAINMEWVVANHLDIPRFFFFSAGQGGFRETFASFCNIDNLV